ncbi:hypothetical protein chiPu_0020530 [Chiloscyllium punctatum]|uniref:Histidine decarboxylase n=1 Tax=Chiloscyllium punctatum TaxID=137246 RepID=A0A401RGU6_CHIPU|nr:hypothetical protein [Chiloscyllium punctatum]
MKGKELVDYIAKYLSTVRERRVSPDVKPGYMRDLLPDRAPQEGESWSSIFEDIERIIMPGVVHWQSPHMHAYFPALTSWPSLLGDMLADAINCLGFTWASSPACTELEMNVLDWLAAMLGLPDHFLHHHPESQGGGVLQSTTSEATLVALLAARKAKIMELTSTVPKLDHCVLNSRLIAYASDQAHSSVEKAGLITFVKIRFLETDEDWSLRGETLKQALEEDRRLGLVPFFVCATLGTTAVCAFDCLCELGPFFSVVTCSFHPSAHLTINPFGIVFPHWQIPLSRRFRSVKLWFVIRSFGVKKLQEHIRHGTKMAKYFETLVRSDSNFEVPAKRHLGLVTFRLKGPNRLTEELLTELNQSGTIYLVPATISKKFIIRFAVTSPFTIRDDILHDWNIIQQNAIKVLLKHSKPANLEQETGE